MDHYYKTVETLQQLVNENQKLKVEKEDASKENQVIRQKNLILEGENERLSVIIS